MQVGQKIKKIRELRNYTQDHLASQLGITQESYSKIEANKTSVSTQRLEQIAKILDVNIFDLMNFDEKKVLFNFTENNQQHAQIGYFSSSEIKELYEKIIEQQKNEIAFLRELLKNKD